MRNVLLTSCIPRNGSHYSDLGIHYAQLISHLKFIWGEGVGFRTNHLEFILGGETFYLHHHFSFLPKVGTTHSTLRALTRLLPWATFCSQQPF